MTTVADALIAWLVDEFDVEVTDDPSVAADLPWPPRDVVRAVRLLPPDSSAAPLAIVETGFPGVLVSAGALVDLMFPVCGCDACDDDVLHVVADLERAVQAIVSGDLEESVWPDGSGRYRLTYPDGRSGSAVREDEAARRREGGAPRRTPPPNGWVPWPRRSASDRPGRGGGRG